MAKRLFATTLSIAMLLVVSCSGLVNAGAVTHGLKTNIAMPNGSVVSLSKDSSDTVEKTTFDNESSLVGVAASANDALIDIQPAGSLIRVAVSGDTKVLVTNLNGDINPGDQLVISSLAGIATKLNTDMKTKKIIGTAGEKFDATSANTKEFDADLPEGGTKHVFVGRISVTLLLNDRSNNEAEQKTQSILATIGEKLTGKPTNPLRLIASGVVSISAFALAGLVLNGSVKGSFISLGRNPLSKDSIIGALLKASLLAIVITSIGLAMAYVILLV